MLGPECLSRRPLEGSLRFPFCLRRLLEALVPSVEASVALAQCGTEPVHPHHLQVVHAPRSESAASTTVHGPATKTAATASLNRTQASCASAKLARQSSSRLPPFHTRSENFHQAAVSCFVLAMQAL